MGFSTEQIREYMGIDIESNGEKAGQEVEAEAEDYNVVAVVDDEYAEEHGMIVYIDDCDFDESGTPLATCYTGEPLQSPYFERYYDELRYATDAEIAEFRKKCAA